MKMVYVVWLSILLSSCADRQIQYEVVKTPTVPIPANLLVDCFIPTIKEDMTFGDSVQLNVALLSALDTCNGQLSAIREIEKSRASQ